MRLYFCVPEFTVNVEIVFHYLQIKNKVPAIIKPAPTAVFQVKVSPKNTTANMMVKAKLSLSIPATFETSPIYKALK